MRTVREIMNPIVYCVSEEDYLPEASKGLKEHTVTGAPVVNRDGDYVGVLSQTDINRCLAGQLGDETSFQDILEGGIPADLSTTRVRDIMTKDILKVSAGATLEELGQALLIGGVHRLLVVDEGEVVGLVSTTDLIHGFLKPQDSVKDTPPRPKRKPYLFESEVVLDDSKVKVTAAGGSGLTLEPPPEFGGTGEHLSPEDLFVTSISSCLALTFREFASRKKLEVVSYACRAIGRLEGDGVSLRFTRVDLYPRVKVRGSAEEAERILTQAKLRCLVGRSSDVIAVLHPKIESDEG